jgi:hypothetical protein
MCQSIPRNSQNRPLNAYQYPPWVLGMLGGILVLSLVGWLSVPNALKVTGYVREAGDACDQKNYTKGLSLCEDALKLSPKFESAKIVAAQALFGLNTPESTDRGLKLLDGVSITEERMEKLKTTFPEKYKTMLSHNEKDNEWKVLSASEAAAETAVAPKQKSRVGRK